MAATPALKIYNAHDEYVGSLKYLEDAAALVGFLGEGASVRAGHLKKTTLWTEGAESQSAGESYDAAADVMNDRYHALHGIDYRPDRQPDGFC